MSGVHLSFDAELAAAFFLEAGSFEAESPFVLRAIAINHVGLEASDGASLVAGWVNVEFLDKVARSSEDGCNSLAILDDHLTPGVLVGILKPLSNIINTVINSSDGLPAELLEDAED